MLSGQYHVVDVFVKNLMQEAYEYSRASTPERQEEIKKKIESLLNQGMSIHTKNKHGGNAAHYLGAIKNKEACLFLWKQGANYLDIIEGALSNKNGQPFVDEIINNMPQDFIIDYLKIAVLAARYGNQQAAENYLAKIPSSQNRDYYQLAINGASSGHQPVAEYFLSKMKAPQTPVYNGLAASAAFGGHQQIAEHFLSKITPPSKPDYNKIIKAAKEGGQHAIAAHFKVLAELKMTDMGSKSVDIFIKDLVRLAKEYARAVTREKKEEIEDKINALLNQDIDINAKDEKNMNAAMYLAMENNGKACLLLARKGATFSDMIEGAFKGKHPALVDYLIIEPPEDVIVNYSAIAGLAAKCGEQDWAENFLNRMKSQNPDYNIVAQSAAQGGHQQVAMHFLSKITVPEKPDYMKVAVAAAAGGYQHIADYFLGKLASEKPDYHRLAAAAAESGHQQVADNYLGKITAPDKVNYNEIARYAARGGHRQLVSYFLGKQKQAQELENSARIAARTLLIFSAIPIINKKNTKKSANTPSGNVPVGMVTTTPLRDVGNTIRSNNIERLKPGNKQLEKQYADGKSSIAHLLVALEENNEPSTPVMCASKPITPASAQAKNKSSTPREKSQEAGYYPGGNKSKLK